MSVLNFSAEQVKRKSLLLKFPKLAPEPVNIMKKKRRIPTSVHCDYLKVFWYLRFLTTYNSFLQFLLCIKLFMLLVRKMNIPGIERIFFINL